jgi:lipopolysaccharide transport system ATP-binding protein
MSDIAIKIENLSKAYQLGDFSTGTLSRDIDRWWARIRGKEDPFLKIGEANDRSIKGTSDIVWSLKNINLEINQGDAIGIIGKNGAGKSTLLKVLSRITSPTQGNIKIKGRIASLLEVGTGFHPELTGRENIYLNGAILGMRKKEITRKFDEIVDFSGVERYIDTPVKRYSSGMYVRLAFAVAAYLESEILIVDEVLAVGDAEFQKKCLGKMNDVSKGEGRTVLFVSHNMGSVAQLCTKTVLLEHGNIIKHDYTNKVIDYYLRSSKESHEGYKGIIADKDITIIEAYTVDDKGEKTISFTHLQKIKVVIDLYVNKWVKEADLRFVLNDLNGKAIFTSDISLKQSNLSINNEIKAVAEIPAHFLRPGNFTFTIATFVHNQFIIHLLENVLMIDVADGGSKYAASEGLDYGYIFFDPKWSLNNVKHL